MPRYPLQGEIWEMQFNPVEGAEQGGMRPALVLSNNDYQDTFPNLVIVAPITTRVRGWPSEVVVDPPIDNRPSVVRAHQIRSVSQDRLINRRGQVSRDTLVAVLNRVVEHLSTDRRRPN